MGILEDAYARQAAAPPPRRIDYDRMNRVMPGQKSALTRASKAAKAARDAVRASGYSEAAEQRADAEAEKLARLIKSHIAVWNEVGAWPDNWHRWQNALDDALPWNRRVDLRDL